MQLNRLKFCECGCGHVVKKDKRFVNGHNSKGQNHPRFGKGKPKPLSQLCECGCGQVTTPGRKFIVGHHICKTPWKPKSPPQLCECGCGEITNEGCRFINLHQNKGHNNPMYGLKGELSPIFGKPNPNASRPGSLNHMFGRTGELSPMYGMKGELAPMFGVIRTSEQRLGTSKGLKKLWSNPEFAEEKINILKERWKNPIFKEKMRDIRIELWNDPKYRSDTILAIRKGWNNKKLKERQSKRMKQLWKSPEYVDKLRLSLAIFPNKPESLILNILNEFYPGQWKYTGDFSFMIDGKNPDFVNEEMKLIIEHFGSYWHKNDNPQDRADLFEPFGYDTLVIWEHELKNLDNAILKIKDFCGNDIC